MSRLDEFYGAGRESASAGLDKMFPEGSLTSTTPWPTAGRTRSRPTVDYTRAIPKELSQHPDTPLHELDPRTLMANQPGLQRGAVGHYMSGDYEKTGRTFADREQSGNRVPVVYRRPSTRSPGTTEDVIMSGHHRAAAALLQGRALHARLVEGP